MDKDLRNAISTAAQKIRKLLEAEYLEQLEGTFDVRPNGVIADQPGAHLSPAQRVQREKIVAAISYYEASGAKTAEAVQRYLREAAFTTLNRFVALKVLEARKLVQQCISAGTASNGYREFVGLAPGAERLPGDEGYRMYLECVFDELSSDVKVLFDRQDAPSVLWPRHNAFEELLTELNAEVLQLVWVDDETIGWFYQFFNSKSERDEIRNASKAGPRNCRELATLNQFFTPRYVVRFLVDNTLARIWAEMAGGTTKLLERCDYFVELDDERSPRDMKDPRSFRILDPACGSGHFLLYAFDLLETMYREAWEHDLHGHAEGPSLRETYKSREDLDAATPVLILEQNLFGVDIDPRAAQIAALALWLRAQRSWNEADVAPGDRPPVRRTGVVVAEPMPGDIELLDDFADRLDPPLLGSLFRQITSSLSLAGEMGVLLRAETELASEITAARDQFVIQSIRPQRLPGFAETEQGELDLSGIDDEAFFTEASDRLLQALHDYAVEAAGSGGARRRLFAGDAAHGVALLEILRHRYDVVLMNPPFGAGSVKAKSVFDKSYPRTKNDVYAAFVERGIELLGSHSLLGAITSRTGFFLSSFQKWREGVLLDCAPPIVAADLGGGVLDDAEVEVAAYVLERTR
jgi:hypothetical protein